MNETAYETACREIFSEYAEKAKNAERLADIKKAELHALSPELTEVDRELSACCLELFGASLGGKDNLSVKIKSIREKNLALQKKRKEILKSMGLSENVTDPVYECSLCNDSGYKDGKMCVCLKTRLAKARLVSAGLGRLCNEETFDSFRPSLQPDKKAAEKIAANKSVCVEYAETFEKTGKNLLLIGPTGLGKTHLSTAIALRAVERGFEVVYESAPDVFRAFENERFRREDVSVEKYFSVDLFILDDLGAEMQTAFTVAALYNLLNTRIVGKKPTIVSTNYTADELKKKYADRITSRLFGEFRPLIFSGADARQLRLRTES